MPDLQRHAGPCTLGSLVPRLLGQCPLGRPSLFPPDKLLYLLWRATCSPISTTFPLPSHYWFPMWLTLPLFLSLYSWLFSTGAQSAATCSRWFLTRWFLCLEDGGDTFLQNVGSHVATSQKTTFLIVIAVKTSNLTFTWLYESGYYHYTPSYNKLTE
jgi:hypothetical protein